MRWQLTTALVLATSMVTIGCVATPSGAEPGDPGATTLASVNASGHVSVGTPSAPDLAGAIAFSSTASDLVTGDRNGVADVFLFGPGWGDNYFAPPYSMELYGGEAFNGASSEPSRPKTLVFSSKASNIVTPDTNGVQDVFADWDEGDPPSRLSQSSVGAQANGPSSHPSASEGSIQFTAITVAFQSAATNLVSGDTNGATDVFVSRAGRLTRASVTSDERQATGSSTEPKVTSDGLLVVFTSSAPDLVSGDTNGVTDIFVRDLKAGTTSRVDVSSSGGQASRASSQPDISADGRFVAFTSADAGLTGGATASAAQIYVRDRVAGTTRRVSVSTSGEPGNGASSQPAISGDGRYVAFTSSASNLVPADTNGLTDVFLHDLSTGTTTRESVSSSGAQSRSRSHSPDLGYGSMLAFLSEPHGGLVPGDTSQTVLLRRPDAPATTFGDFDRDGLSDVIARTGKGELRLFRGSGAGLAPSTRIGASGWNAMADITRHGDFNSDGREDVIASEKSTGALWLYPGTRTYLAPRLQIGARGWNGMREVTAVGDFTRDGKPDLVAVQANTGDLYLYPGRGTGLEKRRIIGHGGWNGMDELIGIGDPNADGYADLIARQRSTGELWLYPGTSTATRFLHRELLEGGWNSKRALAAVGDFDRDGDPDIAGIRNSTSRLEVGPATVAGFTSTVSAIL
ncbi:VCBS repeat-containing protein [Terrabacter sp. Ter38]|uniref:VCBS repeat-containing protein n=1 Tax=Terrabacter sp. Ter38 TaxID=2926030 RepID=UPI002118E805|nr:FG-GAP-like repeat-containing protein [Terrabacter sp. Ter38]